MGDVNHDGSVNVNDIMMIVNYILGLAVIDFDEEMADVNHDGSINVIDVMEVVQIILGNE